MTIVNSRGLIVACPSTLPPCSLRIHGGKGIVMHIWCLFVIGYLRLCMAMRTVMVAGCWTIGGQLAMTGRYTILAVPVAACGNVGDRWDSKIVRDK
jgi:hypothetical protein